MSLGSLIPDVHSFTRSSEHFSILRLHNVNFHFLSEITHYLVSIILHFPWDKVLNPHHAIQNPTKCQHWLPFCVISTIPPLCTQHFSHLNICCCLRVPETLVSPCTCSYLTSWDSSFLSFHCLYFVSLLTPPSSPLPTHSFN